MARAKTTKPLRARAKTVTKRTVKATVRKKSVAPKATRAATRSVRAVKPVSRTRATTVKKAAIKKRVQRVHKSTKKVLVPHKENDFRPHLIRVHGLVAVLVIALLAQVLYGFITTGHLSVLGRVSNIETADLLTDTNEARRAQGLAALHISDELSQAAFLKAQNMFDEQYWAHVSPSGEQPWKWFGDVGYNYSYAGENLAKNYPTADATVQAWMNSKTHRDNILKDKYVDVGFAVVDGKLRGENTTLVVALYGAPATAVAVEGSATHQVADFAAPSVATSVQNPFAYFGSALESLSPVTVAILGLLGLVAIVGVVAHHYRKQLPKAWQKSWRAHQGMYTFVGMITLGVLIIVATGGGSI